MRRQRKLSSNNKKGPSLRWRLILLAVGLVGIFSPAIPGARQVTVPGSLPIISTAYADDTGNTANTTPDNTAGNNTAPADNGGPAPALGSAAAENVPVGLNDVLHVTVIGQNDLTNDYQVDNAGDITMPYIGKVHVAGLQIDQVGPVITKKLDTIYNDVQVTVMRRAVGGI